ncbi:MAG TPA: 50S ribosomal protein L25 [Verrucomicrobiae bacterium]|jgi:large subunit ribosomal protein L25|nr:50S ribosomal protein L25 [Verrucomicrobiae bacterium]
MKSVALTAFPRTLSRRGGAKRLRAANRVPAVIYGRHNPPQSLEINLKDFKDVMHNAASEILLVDLAVDGDPKPKRLALVQEVQHHVLTRKVLHVDLHEVAPDEKVVVQVPVEAVGEAVGVKTGGGTLEHVLFKLKVRALPKDLPEVLHADVSHLEIGKAIHIGEMKAPPGVEILGDKDIPVLSVAAPVSEEQEAASLESATAPAGEVEMMKEKKEDGTEGEAKPGEKAPAKGAEKAPAKGAEKGAAAPAAKGAAAPAAKGAAAPAGKAAAPADKGGDKKGKK